MEGIKESKEAIAVIPALAAFLKKAKADGVISWWDLPAAGPLILAVNTAMAGSEKIPAEIKDLSSDEMSELLQDLLAAAMTLISAVMQ